MIQVLENYELVVFYYLVFFNLMQQFLNIKNNTSAISILLGYEFNDKKQLFLFNKKQFLVNNSKNPFFFSISSGKIAFRTSFFLKKIYSDFYFKNLKNLFRFFKKIQLNFDELELKGINYRFTKNNSSLILDLGCSHFQLFYYPVFNFFFSLWKKKLKRIILLTFNKHNFFSSVNFFRYSLKSVGPYKLKGFQFINERIKLKQGKKPFK